MTLGVSTTPGQATCPAVVNQHIMNSIVFCVCFYSVTVCYFYLFGCYFVFLVGRVDVYLFFDCFLRKNLKLGGCVGRGSGRTWGRGRI